MQRLFGDAILISGRKRPCSLCQRQPRSIAKVPLEPEARKAKRRIEETGAYANDGSSNKDRAVTRRW